MIRIFPLFLLCCFPTQTFPLLPCCSEPPARPERPGLSHPTLTTLRRFYSGRSHKRHSRLFLDAHVVQTLPNQPGRDGKAES